MARTAGVFARVEPEVKEQAELVLDRLGIPMSNAVGMFLRQIVLQRGIPFEMKLPSCEEPVSYGSSLYDVINRVNRAIIVSNALTRLTRLTIIRPLTRMEERAVCFFGKVRP